MKSEKKSPCILTLLKAAQAYGEIERIGSRALESEKAVRRGTLLQAAKDYYETNSKKAEKANSADLARAFSKMWKAGGG